MKKTSTMYIVNEIATRGTITEREINLLKNRANRGDWVADICGRFAVTDEQAEKGLQWILSRLATKAGKPRKGFEDCSELIDLAKDPESRFTFEGFHWNSNGWISWASPIYRLSNGLQAVVYACTGQGVITIL